MDSLFVQLRRAREAKRLSIADISAATNINPDFLQAIEEGRTNILPQTYVRAFLREYAAVVGLPPGEIMKLYDEGSREAERDRDTGQSGPPSSIPAATSTMRTVSKGWKERKTTFGLLGLLFLLAAILYWNLSRPPGSPATAAGAEEIQAKVEFPSPSVPREPGGTQKSDSLTLSAVTLDSVWVHIVLDNQTTLEYLFRPNRSATWKAKESFSVSLGNAGAVEFSLNNTPIGTLGKRGAVVRNVPLTRRSLEEQRRQNK